MRTKVTTVPPELLLARVLAALEQELLEASDAEIRAAAKDLGMNLDMKGSIAFSGLRYPAKVSLADWFGPDALTRIREHAKAKREHHEKKSTLPPTKQTEEGNEE